MFLKKIVIEKYRRKEWTGRIIRYEELLGLNFEMMAQGKSYTKVTITIKKFNSRRSTIRFVLRNEEATEKHRQL